MTAQMDTSEWLDARDRVKVDATLTPGATPKVREILSADLGDGHAQLDAYGWPGGYPIVYIRREIIGSYGQAHHTDEYRICADCATALLTTGGPEQPEAPDEDGYAFDPSPSGVWVADYYAHEEGESVYCEECGALIAEGDEEEGDDDAL